MASAYSSTQKKAFTLIFAFISGLAIGVGLRSVSIRPCNHIDMKTDFAGPAMRKNMEKAFPKHLERVTSYIPAFHKFPIQIGTTLATTAAPKTTSTASIVTTTQGRSITEVVSNGTTKMSIVKPPRKNFGFWRSQQRRITLPKISIKTKKPDRITKPI